MGQRDGERDRTRATTTPPRSSVWAICFDELKDGLDQASHRSAAQIKGNIKPPVAAPIDEWSPGPGRRRARRQDGRHDEARPSRTGLDLTGSLDRGLETGYVEDADIPAACRHDAATTRSVCPSGIQPGTSASTTSRTETEMEKRLPEATKTHRSGAPATDAGKPTTTRTLRSSAASRAGSRLQRAGAKRHFVDRAQAATMTLRQARRRVGQLPAVPGSRPRPLDVEAFGRSFDPVHPALVRSRSSAELSDERTRRASLASFFSTPMAREEQQGKRKASSRLTIIEVQTGLPSGCRWRRACRSTTAFCGDVRRLEEHRRRVNRPDP